MYIIINLKPLFTGYSVKRGTDHKLLLTPSLTGGLVMPIRRTIIQFK